MKELKIAAFVLALAAGSAAAHEGHHHDAAAAGSTQTISGEIVDMACYMSGEEHGAKHAKCAGMCVTGGAPMGLLTKDGGLYLVVADHADEKPYEEAKKLAGGDAKLSGKVTKKGGVQALIVNKTEKP
jgi:type 1 fimbria pilin